MQDEKRNERIEAAIDECCFAKQVNTKDGLAILINGTVISVETGLEDEGFWVEVITRALRRSGCDRQIASGGTAALQD